MPSASSARPARWTSIANPSFWCFLNSAVTLAGTDASRDDTSASPRRVGGVFMSACTKRGGRVTRHRPPPSRRSAKRSTSASSFDAEVRHSFSVRDTGISTRNWRKSGDSLLPHSSHR